MGLATSPPPVSASSGGNFSSVGLTEKSLSKYYSRTGRIDPIEYGRILDSWSKGVTVHGVSYGKIYATVIKRNVNAGSTWLKIRMMEKTDTDVELLIWEKLRVRCSKIERWAWGKVRLSDVPEANLLQLDLMGNGDFLLPYVPLRPEQTQLMKVGKVVS